MLPNALCDTPAERTEFIGLEERRHRLSNSLRESWRYRVPDLMVLRGAGTAEKVVVGKGL
jgi:hypothetical protein